MQENPRPPHAPGPGTSPAEITPAATPVPDLLFPEAGETGIAGANQSSLNGRSLIFPIRNSRERANLYGYTIPPASISAMLVPVLHPPFKDSGIAAILTSMQFCGHF